MIGSFLSHRDQMSVRILSGEPTTIAGRSPCARSAGWRAATNGVRPERRLREEATRLRPRICGLTASLFASIISMSLRRVENAAPAVIDARHVCVNGVSWSGASSVRSAAGSCLPARCRCKRISKIMTPPRAALHCVAREAGAGIGAIPHTVGAFTGEPPPKWRVAAFGGAAWRDDRQREARKPCQWCGLSRTMQAARPPPFLSVFGS